MITWDFKWSVYCSFDKLCIRNKTGNSLNTVNKSSLFKVKNTASQDYSYFKNVSIDLHFLMGNLLKHTEHNNR